MNEMAEENRLIKQAVLGTYERMKGKYSNLRKRNQNNPKDDNGKQMSQSNKKAYNLSQAIMLELIIHQQ